MSSNNIRAVLSGTEEALESAFKAGKKDNKYLETVMTMEVSPKIKVIFGQIEKKSPKTCS